VEASGDLSLTELEQGTVGELKVEVYPNPSTAYFSIRITGVQGKTVQLRVSDAMGRMVEVKGGVAANSTQTIGHRYLPGVYFVEAVQDGRKVVVKCIKQ
jgi:hypothetical protein